jgi:hypothetical protein
MKMATNCRAIRHLKYRGARLKPGDTFLAKDKDAVLFQLAAIAEILEVLTPEPTPEPQPIEVDDAKDEIEESEEGEEESEAEQGNGDSAPEGESNQEEGLWGKNKLALRAVCDELGLEYKHNDTKGYMIDKISAHYRRRDMRAED